MAETAITKELVLDISKSARLDLTNTEIEKYTQQLNVILEAFKQLDEVQAEGTEPSYHPIEIADNLREDRSEIWIWDPLANVKDSENSYIRGPKIK